MSALRSRDNRRPCQPILRHWKWYLMSSFLLQWAGLPALVLTPKQ